MSGSVQQLAGVAEACEILGVSRQRLAVLREREDFPQPVCVLACGCIWSVSDLQAYAGRSRPVGRPRKA